ncbi:MAG: hypothetical protein JWN61_772 [Pseudonocardiales bacterium]|nr:hypothetical protein [Pseudonocardiales bacterium]
MALIYQAQLSPSKTETLAAWLPHQPWLDGADVSRITLLGAYRFDDPAGEVGIETHVVAAADGRVLHVPVTYRSAPLAGAEDGLIGTMEHSVLGTRYVYDGPTDPIYVQALTTTILTGGEQAPFDLVTDDGLKRREVTTLVRGSGTPSTHVPAGVEPVVLRTLEPGHTRHDAATLTGTWPGQDAPVLLAYII